VWAQTFLIGSGHTTIKILILNLFNNREPPKPTVVPSGIAGTLQMTQVFNAQEK
jgi:hypothetical protein